MNGALEVLKDELKLIKNNVKNNDSFNLNHSEIISFIRTFIQAVDNGTIKPFHELTTEDKDKVIVYLKLMRTYGIIHVDRSRLAAKCLVFLESIAEKKNFKPIDGYPG